MPDQPAESRADQVTLPAPETISILGLEDSEPGHQDRLTLRRPQDWRLGRMEVPLDVFRQRVASFLGSMHGVITDLPQTFGKYQLDEVTVSVEVSAKGQISLLGSGGELAGTSGLTFTFTRRPDAATPTKARRLAESGHSELGDGSGDTADGAGP